MSGDNREGVRQGSNDADPPVFQSRLRAKREERMLQRQLEQEVAHIPASAVSRSLESNAKAALRNDPGAPSAAKDAGITPHGFAHRPMVEVGDEAVKRRERAEARKRVIEYQGNVWDAVCSNDLKMVQSYFLVEGAQNLLRRRHPNAEQGGRSLLHCAAWHGCAPIVEFILSAGCAVDAIDSAASKTTALLEAARAGHAAVCVSLLQHGASPRHFDSYGDTAFHWSGRQGHGTVLMQMALELERNEPGSTAALWVAKNYKGRTVIDFVQANAFVVSLLQKRLGVSFNRALGSAQGKRRSRFPVRAANLARKASLVRVNSQPDKDEMSSLSGVPAKSLELTLSGVEELGLDVSSFAYKSRGNAFGR